MLSTYKLKGLDKYIVNVESKEVAAIVCLQHRIGVTPQDIEETDINVPFMFMACIMDEESINGIINISN